MSPPSIENLSICQSCGWEIRQGRKHEAEGDGECRVVEIDTERVIGWSRRRTRDLYKKK